MSRVTREQWRKAWSVMRRLRPIDPMDERQLERAARKSRCDWLAIAYAAEVFWTRRLSDPFTYSVRLRAALRWGPIPRRDSQRIREWYLWMPEEAA